MALKRSVAQVRRDGPKNGALKRHAARPTVDKSAATLAAYAARGDECAFANVRMMGRVVSAVYDEALRPAELRASQLALLWAILATEPVDISRLARVTQTDQTTLSRTVEHLQAAGLVSVAPGEDRRVRVVRLTPLGRRRFLRAMPYWEAAQREISTWISLTDLRTLGRAARHRARGIATTRSARTTAADIG